MESKRSCYFFFKFDIKILHLEYIEVLGKGVDKFTFERKLNITKN